MFLICFVCDGDMATQHKGLQRSNVSVARMIELFEQADEEDKDADALTLLLKR